jgi:2-polyprenyl-3-methyl-5-hydroxy-6-metoxy-1,4-benzoquinol methylase
MSKYSCCIDLDNPNDSHTKIIHWVGNGKKVLEFGCAAGHMSKILRDQFQCQVFGVEINPEDAKKAMEFCQQVVAEDIEKDGWCEKIYGMRFDVAIFADVLEHLKDPLPVLKKTREFLLPDGFLLVSAPNIANISIRLELLAGKFEYEDLGILDRSHLRFFTLESLLKLIQEAGYYTTGVDPVTKEMSASKIHERLNILGLIPTEKTFDYFRKTNASTYQFIIKALKEKPNGYPFIGEKSQKIQIWEEQPNGQKITIWRRLGISRINFFLRKGLFVLRQEGFFGFIKKLLQKILS